MGRPDRRAFAQLCEAALRSIDQLARHGPHLVEEAPKLERGYPASLRAKEGAGGADPAGGGPVLAMVIAGDRDIAADIWKWAAESVAALQELVSLASYGAAELMPAGDAAIEELRGRQSAVTLCLNCNEPALPRPRAGRCNACYMWRLRHEGDDRPEHLWSTADIDETAEAA